MDEWQVRKDVERGVRDAQRETIGDSLSPMGAWILIIVVAVVIYRHGWPWDW